MQTHRPQSRLAFRAGRFTSGSRVLPEEVPVAISYNGSTQAVMMATPGDLQDFAIGFSLTEGIAQGPEITEITIVETPEGFDLQLWLTPLAEARLSNRRRTMAGPVGCGLCGIDSIAEAIRTPRKIPASALTLTPEDIIHTMALLPAGQTLHNATRAAHAAAFYTPGIGITALREDVGRHNALDKLIGALIQSNANPSDGAIILTSRVSIDMVQKCCALGSPILIAASAPTAHAVALAEAAGLTLIALARGDGFEVFTHPHRLTEQRSADVA